MVSKRQLQEMKALFNPANNLPLAAKILSLIANHFTTSVEEIKSSSRKENVSTARYVFCLLASHFTHCTQDEMGSLINRKQTVVNRFYTTALNAINEQKKELCGHVVTLLPQVKQITKYIF